MKVSHIFNRWQTWTVIQIVTAKESTISLFVQEMVKWTFFLLVMLAAGISHFDVSKLFCPVVGTVEKRASNVKKLLVIASFLLIFLPTLT